jgi:hypothetical protein
MNVFYQEGYDAAADEISSGHFIFAPCPYRSYTYGFNQWYEGYNAFISDLKQYTR